jgi:hypothetical protein
MQRIYATGTGLVEAAPNWADIPKPENFRCSTKVLNLANAIRRDGDDLVQVPGQRLRPEGIMPTPEGSAHLFILPADETRDANLVRVRDWMAARTGDNRWRLGDGDQEQIKLLVIVHQMAAKRLGFESFTQRSTPKRRQHSKTVSGWLCMAPFTVCEISDSDSDCPYRGAAARGDAADPRVFAPS